MRCSYFTRPHWVDAKKLDPNEWNGHWRSEDSRMVMRVADADGGLIEIAQLDEKENALHVSLNHLYVREEGDATLFNLIDQEEPGQAYTFGRMVRKTNSAVFWPARTDSMEQLIARRLIVGQVKVQNNSKQVTVTGGYEMLARQLAAPEGWLLLQMDEPFTLMREQQSL
jgi:hypothetical protein